MTLTFLAIYNEVAGQAWSMYDGDAESVDEMESALKSSINNNKFIISKDITFVDRVKKYYEDPSKKYVHYDQRGCSRILNS